MHFFQEYFFWYMKQKVQYYFGDLFLCIGKKRKYTFDDYIFWRKKKKCLLCARNCYYIIRRRSGRKKLEGTSTLGICGMLLFNLADIKYADDRGYIPLIDMCSYANTYLSKNDVGKYNAWEFFFEQGVDIRAIEKKNKYICSSGILQNNLLGYDELMEKSYSDLEISSWRNLLKKYIVINSNIQQKVDNYLVNTSFEDRNILGVLCRGTDFNCVHPKNHPIQPSVEQVIEKIYDYISKNKVDYIFLVTEDKIYFDKIKIEFQDKVISYAEPNIDYNDGYFVDNIPNETMDRKKNGEDYLISVLLLSRCNAFIGGITSGTICTLLFGENLDFVYYFRLGYY